ncbi:CYTH domain containing protein [uncultured Caudovirales phage]|uniref:CYTH domain containing protein n=1 Tax=uncultured Caudovirales phage TaxID=2100421 RepID=A0A6J5RXU0_9CAUD|nr:CYTH domain containing protein [uncultured Caudovirales phage]
MSTKLEIEKKFLVKFPTSWSTLSEMFDELIDVKRISQTYLKSKDGDPASRVRKTVEGLTGDTETVYHFNQKKPVEAGIHEETEYEINKSKYENHLKEADPSKVEVQKTRFVFDYNDQVFELDVFKGPLKGLAVLEIELEDKDVPVELPPYLKIIKEVTKDKRYSNYELASTHKHV